MTAIACGRWGLLIPAVYEVMNASSEQFMMRLMIRVRTEGGSIGTQRLPMYASVAGSDVNVLVNQKVSL